jgi:hypothetical protein
MVTIMVGDERLRLTFPSNQYTFTLISTLEYNLRHDNYNLIFSLTKNYANLNLAFL